MTRLRKVPRAIPDDLRSRVHFSADTGQIWLHEHRMLLVHAEAQAALRKELIDTLGLHRARGSLLRMGYASGTRDAELSLSCGGTDDLETFMAGPRLHALEGIVRVTPVRVELDRPAGKFYGEFLWENSWEGTWHKRHYGVQAEPVCWTQIGYACGYTSGFMGRPILYKEVECVGSGHATCRIVGKPVEEWEDAAEQMTQFRTESIAEQLFDLQSQVAQLRSTIGEQSNMPADMVGASPGFRAAFELLCKAGSSQIAVLLLGETGVGKEMFARYLHDLGRRAKEPFVAVNCAAIPHDLVEAELFGVEKGAYTGALASRPGRFERAHGGTLFLDEVGDLPLSGQAKLLRVLQDGELERVGDQRSRKVDVRLIAATNANLQEMVRDGRFRSDLFYRLGSYPIRIPPLRQRPEDVPLLAKRFLAKYSALHEKKLLGFSDRAKKALVSYAWPGNIRELQNMVERGVILAPSGGRVEVDHLFSSYEGREVEGFGLDSRGGLDGGDRGAVKDLCGMVLSRQVSLDELEGMLLGMAVDRARGNLSSAARMLGLTRPQLAYRLKLRRTRAEEAPQRHGEAEPGGEAPKPEEG